MDRSKPTHSRLFGSLRYVLVLGCLSWLPAALGTAAPKCPKQLELRARFEAAWNNLDAQPPSLSLDQAFQLAMRDASWTIRERFTDGPVFSEPLERQFRLVLPHLLTPILEHLLGRQPKATQAMRQKFMGSATDAVVLVVHTRRNDEASTGAYLEQARFENLPVLALVSPSYSISEPRLLAQLATARHSSSGELRDVWIDADEAHLMGGAFGDCLTTATAQALERMLDYPHRQQAIAHLHLKASWGWQPYAKQWQQLPNETKSNKLFQYFNDRTGGNGFRNEALDPFEYVEWEFVSSEPSYFELKLRRLKDSKIGRVRLYGFETP